MNAETEQERVLKTEEETNLKTIKMIMCDMQGIVYRFTRNKGKIEAVDTITIEQGKEGEEVFEEAIREYHMGYRNPQFSPIIETSPAYQLELENRMIKERLKEGVTNLPFGLELNMNAARYLVEVLNTAAHKPFVVSSSVIGTSQLLLEACLLMYCENVDLKADDVSQALLQIPVYNMSDFGSKKSGKAWKQVFEQALIAHHGKNCVDLVTIIEDQPEKCEAAVIAAKSLGYNPLALNQIKTETNVLDYLGS